MNQKQITKIICDYAPKAMAFCEKNPEASVTNYLYNLVNTQLFYTQSTMSSQQPGKKVVPEGSHATQSAKVMHMVQAQWNAYSQTGTGRQLIEHFANKPRMREVLQEPSQLDEFLSVLTNKKTLLEMTHAFIARGDARAVEKIVQKKTNPKIVVDLDLCLVAVEHDQVEMLEMLFKKDKHQARYAPEYWFIHARAAMQENAQNVFSHIIKTHALDKEELLANAVFEKHEKFAHELVDCGANAANLKVDARTDEHLIKSIVHYHQKKILHDDLQQGLAPNLVSRTNDNARKPKV